MPSRKYFPPEPRDLAQKQREAERLNERLRALFADGGDPSAWRLPSGNTLAEATGHELMQVGLVLGYLGARKLEEVTVNTQRTADNTYRIEVNGEHVGEIRRASQVLRGGWVAIDINGQRHRDSGNEPFKSRDDAVDALVRRFA